MFVKNVHGIMLFDWWHLLVNSPVSNSWKISRHGKSMTMQRKTSVNWMVRHCARCTQYVCKPFNPSYWPDSTYTCNCDAC